MTNNDGFIKAMVTSDFIYFMDDSEGDDNGSVLMYDKKTKKLVSDNYMANRDMYEILLHYKYEWICEELEYARRCMLEQHKQSLAMDFFLKNKFPGKTPNLVKDGPKGVLNKQLKLKLGFELTAEELRQTQILIKQTTNKSQLHM